MRKLRAAAALTVLAAGCTGHPLDQVPRQPVSEEVKTYPLSLEKDVDILFVIDNSGSMAEEQANLQRNIPRFIDALRTPKLGPDGSGRPCSEQDTSGCRIPNVQIGVVSTDVGAGGFVPGGTCAGDGDGGRLLSKPMVPGCTPPQKPYIRYFEGEANVDGSGDAVEHVKQAFQCIATIGTQGCGLEHPLEAARRALDPKLNLNPGFIRDDALLAVVLITDEDDCSAQKPQLFDPQLDLGPLNFRCFQYGVECDIADNSKAGPRKNCRPGGDWLTPVEDYVAFFKGLKRDGRVLVSAITGPAEPVAVGTIQGSSGIEPSVMPSCQTKDGKAAPALRLSALVNAFGGSGQRSSICTDDFGPALSGIAKRILGNINLCLDPPPLTAQGALVCSAGQRLGTDESGAPVTCEQSCLERADCVVKQAIPTPTGQQTQELPRCAPELFADPSRSDCGALCPCWRLVPRASCGRDGLGGLALDILRQGEAPKGSAARVSCQVSLAPWGSAEYAAQPQCY